MACDRAGVGIRVCVIAAHRDARRPLGGSRVYKEAIRSRQNGNPGRYQAMSTKLCAYTYKSGDCGDNLGKKVFVKNRKNKKSVLATVEVTWRSGNESGTKEETHKISAGGKKFIGCTRKGGVVDPNTTYTYKVIGCEEIRDDER